MKSETHLRTCHKGRPRPRVLWGGKGLETVNNVLDGTLSDCGLLLAMRGSEGLGKGKSPVGKKRS